MVDTTWRRLSTRILYRGGIFNQSGSLFVYLFVCLLAQKGACRSIALCPSETTRNAMICKVGLYLLQIITHFAMMHLI